MGCTWRIVPFRSIGPIIVHIHGDRFRPWKILFKWPKSMAETMGSSQHTHKNLTLQARPRSFVINGCFLKWWASPTTMCFPTKNDHFGVWNGGFSHHFRKPPKWSCASHRFLWVTGCLFHPVGWTYTWPPPENSSLGFWLGPSDGSGWDPMRGKAYQPNRVGQTWCLGGNPCVR